MGLLSNMAQMLQWSGQQQSVTRLASPWSGTNTLAQITADVFGSEYAPITRAEAMRVPAVAKARALIVGTLAHQPLRVYEGDEPVADLPEWVQGTDGELPLWHRMAWTLDDMFFTGWALWVKRREAGRLGGCYRVPRDWWQFDSQGRIEVRTPDGTWEHAPQDDVILFPGPQEGLLDLAADTIRGARAVERTILDRARTPFSAIDIRNTDGTVLEGTEIDELIDDFVTSRRNVEGSSIGYVPSGYELDYHGEKTDMLIEARNAYRLDVAAFANLPGQILDASLSTASLTYSTKEGARNELIDYSLRYWADPIASRLSNDDVVEPGQRTRFDMTEFTAVIQRGDSPVTED